VENTLKRIKALNSTDRLSCVAGIAVCTQAVTDSMNGWNYWLTALQLMDSFDEETLRRFFEKLKSIAVEVLEFDLESTKIGMERIKTSQPVYGG